MVRLIQASLGNPPLTTTIAPGTMPPNFQGTGAFYHWITGKPDVGLNTAGGLIIRTYEVECIGANPVDAQTLAYQIDAALDGFRGNLTDADSTWVDSCFQTDWIGPTMVDRVARNQRIKIEYEICYRDSPA